MTAKFVRESISDYAELALPNDANALGNLLGGKIMHLVDLAGAIAAMRHSGEVVVTATIDQMQFIHPVKIGQLVRLRASVNRVFKTSMEVGVKVLMEDLLTGREQHVSSAFLTFVAIDTKGNRIEIRPVVPETPDERRRHEEAGTRREYRLARRAAKSPAI